MKTVFAIFLCFSLCIISGAASQATDRVFHIGISQIVEHPALDAARKGFVDDFKDSGFKNINFNY